MKAFEGYHPVILFFYFLAMIFITMFTMNPILLAISFGGGLALCGTLVGGKELLKSLAYSIPLLALIALTNPVFVHRGSTVLFYMNDNPVTLESILYGISVAVMIVSVFYWFRCYHEVMTGDKFIYLFGRVIPKLSLLLSMVLGFVPKFKRRYREIDDAQKALGVYASKGYVDRIRSKLRVLGILISWSLENSVETADSMRARGYGLKGRTSYAIYRWTRRDTAMAAIVACLTAMSVTLMFLGYGDFAFYPELSALDFAAPAAILYAGLFALAFVSTAAERKENLFWRYLRSKI